MKAMALYCCSLIELILWGFFVPLLGRGITGNMVADAAILVVWIAYGQLRIPIVFCAWAKRGFGVNYPLSTARWISAFATLLALFAIYTSRGPD